MGIAVNAELLATYSRRGMLQTFTDSAGFGWHERTVMGWRAAKDAGERINWMPARYAAEFDVTKRILNYTAPPQGACLQACSARLPENMSAYLIRQWERVKAQADMLTA